jgi:hypothetical protein
MVSKKIETIDIVFWEKMVYMDRRLEEIGMKMKLRPNLCIDSERGVVSGLAELICRLGRILQNEIEISRIGRNRLTQPTVRTPNAAIRRGRAAPNG